MITRKRIFADVVAQLKRIRTGNTYRMYGETNNYLSDVGLNVFPWRTAVFQRNELPALIVRDLDEPQELPNPRSARVKRSLHLQVEIVLAGENANDLLADIYSDVEAAIGEGRESVWADYTDETRPRISRAVVEQDSNRIAGGVFEFFIDYPTLAFKSNQ